MINGNLLTTADSAILALSAVISFTRHVLCSDTGALRHLGGEGEANISEFEIAVITHSGHGGSCCIECQEERSGRLFSVSPNTVVPFVLDLSSRKPNDFNNNMRDIGA